jgi:hypothetical protein
MRKNNRKNDQLTANSDQRLTDSCELRANSYEARSPQPAARITDTKKGAEAPFL